MTNTMQTIELGKFTPTKSQWGFASPWTIAFVYNSDGKNYVVKGMCDDVRDYIDEHFPKCFYNMTYWKNGCRCSSWSASSKLMLYFNQVHPFGGRQNMEVILFADSSQRPKIHYFRRMPHRWIPLFDEAGMKG